MKRMIYSGFAALLLMSANVFAVEEAHNFQAKQCRARPGGQVEIVGISATDGVSRHLTFPTSLFNKDALDRYLSLCMTALVSGVILRVDYVECTGTTCETTSGTTVQIKSVQ